MRGKLSTVCQPTVDSSSECQHSCVIKAHTMYCTILYSTLYWTCTVYICSTLCSVQCIVQCTVYRAVYSVLCSVQITVHCTVYCSCSVQCAEQCTLQCTRKVYRTVYCAVYSVLYTVQHVSDVPHRLDINNDIRWTAKCTKDRDPVRAASSSPGSLSKGTARIPIKRYDLDPH